MSIFFIVLKNDVIDCLLAFQAETFYLISVIKSDTVRSTFHVFMFDVRTCSIKQLSSHP